MSATRKSVFLAAAIIVISLVLSGCSPPHCSTEFLITAINDANSNGPGTDTIDLAAGCTYELGVIDNTIDGNNGTPSITTSIIINGNGATVRRSTAAQKNAIRLFHVSQSGNLVLNNIRLHDGIAVEPPDTTLPLRNHGGAVFNAGVLTANQVDFDYNRARRQGGAIYNTGTININSSTFQNNEADYNGDPGGSGGAILNDGIATISASTFVGNTASQSGGALSNAYGGIMAITNSTISGNSATMPGIVNGAAIISAGNLTISYSTITENVSSTSGAVWSTLDTIEIFNSIIAGNIPSNCSYPATSPTSGTNLDDDGTCDGFTLTDDPQLEPLANNGGPTLTHAFHPSSPAKNAASGFFPPMDQRGMARPHGSAADLGSLELGSTIIYNQNPATLAGIVWHDQNGDTIKDPGEGFFAGVEVTLGVGTCATAGDDFSVLSQPDGVYQFILPSPNAGTYCVSVDPLVEPNTSLLIPGGFTLPTSNEYEVTIVEGEARTDLDFGWQFQFDNIETPLMEITNVHLASTPLHVNNFEDVEVTVTNNGTGDAIGFELVLVPQYGVGPPNPAGYELLPPMAPGASHTVLFSPGVIYSSGGTYTLRTLVTDAWYATGDPDNLGLYGDLEDTTITVTEFACPEFDLEPIELVFLPLPWETRILPLYVKFNGPVSEDIAVKFQSKLGEFTSYRCGLQGFEDRIFCLTEIPEGDEGSEVRFELILPDPDCPEAIYELPAVQIPVPEPPTTSCNADLEERSCVAAGGTYYKINDKQSTCICP